MTETGPGENSYSLTKERTVLVRVINSILSPVRLIRDDAANALHQSGFLDSLLRELTWGDVLELHTNGHCLIRTPGLEAVQICYTAAQPIVAWSTIALEEDWLHDENVLFPHIDKEGLCHSATPLTDAELRIISYHPRGYIPPPSAKDQRDIAALLLINALEGDISTALTLRWSEVDTELLAAGADPDNPRLDLEANLLEWKATWRELTAIEMPADSPVLIPTQPGRIRWKGEQPCALSRSALLSAVRTRLSLAHPRRNRL